MRRDLQLGQFHGRASFDLVKQTFKPGIFGRAALFAYSPGQTLQLRLSKFATQQRDLDLIQFVEQPPRPPYGATTALGGRLDVLQREQRLHAHHPGHAGYRRRLAGCGSTLRPDDPESLTAAGPTRRLGAARLG